MAKRKYNQELNLTSYIDLMSTLIIFLLMTAVWNQLDALSTSTSNVTSGDSAASSPEKASLSVTVLESRVELSENDKTITIPHVGDEIDIETLVKNLKTLKQRYPNRDDIVLNTDNRIPYRLLIQVFDLLVGNQWPDVGVNTL